MSLLQLFCDIDDFWQEFEPFWHQSLLENGKNRKRKTQMCMSEMMTIVVHFHQKRYRDFKTYYTEHVAETLKLEFPNLLSYSRFIQLMPRILLALCVYLQYCYGHGRGIAFIDSTAFAVCHNRRISQHRVFEGVAERGRTSVDWFFGFKLHLVVNDCGEILSCCVTPGNTDEVALHNSVVVVFFSADGKNAVPTDPLRFVGTRFFASVLHKVTLTTFSCTPTTDDRRPVPKLVQHLFGKLFGDKDYLSKPLADQLMEDQALELVTKVRSNMKAKVMDELDKFFLRKRAIIETINDQLKNISQIEHTRHRSLVGFMTNLLGGLIAYCHQPKKPSLNLEFLSQLALA